MKKLVLLFLCAFSFALLTACNETDDQPESPEVPQQETPSPSSFFEVMDFEPSGYTPGYRYFLAGSLNETGEITQIHFDMVSTSNISKRSENYQMNVTYIMVGGLKDYQTIDIFIGGSTENIAQAMYSIKGQIKADGSDLLMDLPLLSFFGAPVDKESIPVDEIYQLLSTGFDNFDITEETTVANLLSQVRLYDSENSVVKNGRKVIGLTGKWGGGTFHEQLLALESYIVNEALTLEELYTFLTETNQADDQERDVVTGVTMMFEPKIIKIVAKAAGIDLWDGEPTVTDAKIENSNHIITVRIMGYHEMLVEVELSADKNLVNLTVVEHTETANIGKDVIDGDFISQLINADQIDDVEIIAGATKTSQALIDAIKTAIDYLNN